MFSGTENTRWNDDGRVYGREMEMSFIHVASLGKLVTPVASAASLSEHVQLHSSEKCRFSIKFLKKLKKSATKTFQILTEAYRNETLFREHVFEWYKKFSGGRVSVEDYKPAGHPAITYQSIAKIHDMSEFPLTSVFRLLRHLVSSSLVHNSKYVGLIVFSTSFDKPLYFSFGFCHKTVLAGSSTNYLFRWDTAHASVSRHLMSNETKPQ
ncbi:hypothetical protein TNCV_4334801 [Trichonephila clavipes]|nr:hypothetical protein TNCV_4334801 [Trichonephila clavipes]